jgi:hypothetical protein
MLDAQKHVLLLSLLQSEDLFCYLLKSLELQAGRLTSFRGGALISVRQLLFGEHI